METEDITGKINHNLPVELLCGSSFALEAFDSRLFSIKDISIDGKPRAQGYREIITHILKTHPIKKKYCKQIIMGTLMTI